MQKLRKIVKVVIRVGRLLLSLSEPDKGCSRQVVVVQRLIGTCTTMPWKGLILTTF